MKNSKLIIIILSLLTLFFSLTLLQSNKKIEKDKTEKQLDQNPINQNFTYKLKNHLLEQIYSEIGKYHPKNYTIKKFKIEQLFVDIEIYVDKKNYKTKIYPEISITNNEIKLKENFNKYLTLLDRFFEKFNNEKLNNRFNDNINNKKTIVEGDIYIFDTKKIYVLPK